MLGLIVSRNKDAYIFLLAVVTMFDACKFQWQAGLDWSPYNTLKSLKCTKKTVSFNTLIFLPSSLHIRILSRPCVGKSYSPNLPSQHKGLVTTRSRSTPQRFRRKTLKTLSIIAFWGRWWAGKWGRETCPETKDLAEWNGLYNRTFTLIICHCYDAEITPRGGEFVTMVLQGLGIG